MTIPPAVSELDGKILPLLGPICFHNLLNFAGLQTEKNTRVETFTAYISKDTSPVQTSIFVFSSTPLQGSTSH